MMLNLSQYQETNQLYTGSRTLVYKAIRASDRQPAIIKVLRNPHPNFNELVQFRNQYIIARNLEHPGIVQPLALERYGNGYALVMPDEGAIALLDYWQQSSRSLDEFFTIAIQLAEALHYLNQQHIIHKDIKPANILIHPETRHVKLIDFSISSLLPKEQQTLTNPNTLEGTLAYISPEQTGRMNRGIDYRTDFYSLGVTFFELLTGKPPFDTSDPMELVHAHIARIPEGCGNGEGIPQIISDIVLKLMAKNAEDRYQSALGLKYDLEQCLQQWQATGGIISFKLGQRDICDRFLIPEKLYGRENEVQTLLDAFERVADRATEMMLVAGFSGIGKTAVVNEVHKPIVKQRGYFIKGKFDQFNRNIPFSAFVQAFRDLMSQLLGESDAELANWKAKILEALGESGQVIIEVIPELEQIIGKQLPVPELSGSAAQNRFNLLFGKFVRVFTTKEHPLVIFLDDLQWADSASLNLLKLLMDESEKGYLLVLGAYRDNEIFAAHPLMLTLNDISKQGASIDTLTLTPLVEEDITRLVADTLLCSTEIATPLSQLVYQKTRGNPFFATQFLKGLYEDGWITFEAKVGYWQCDLTQVRLLALTDDVVTFMGERLRKLPETTQEILKLSACIGNQFDLETLAVVCEKSQDEVATDIWDALQEGLVFPVTENYKFFQGGKVGEQQTDNVYVIYRFLHDRVQQAAYALIEEDKKQPTHLKIGQLLLENTPPAKREAHLFEIVNQLNYGVDLITDTAQRYELAQLNLEAAAKAKASTAYAAAKESIDVALTLLPPDSWEQTYEFTSKLYELAAEVAFLQGEFEQMEAFADQLLHHAKDVLDTVKIYDIKIQAYYAQRQFIKAIEVGRDILTQLGIDLPENPTIEDFHQEQELTLAQLNQRQIRDFAQLPLTQDPYVKACLSLLASMTIGSGIANPNLFALISLKQVNLAIKHGNTDTSPFAYACYGTILCSEGQETAMGYQFGKLALRLLEVNESPTVAAKTLIYCYLFINHWQESLHQTLEPFLRSYQISLSVGDLETATMAAQVYCAHAYFCGLPLPELESEMLSYSQVMQQFKQEHCLESHQIYHQAVLNLLGKVDDPCCLAGDVYQLKTDSEGMYTFESTLHQLILCYLFDNHSHALGLADQAKANLNQALALLYTPLVYFYDSLARLQLHHPSEQVLSESDLEIIQVNQEKLYKWECDAPMNYLHKYQIVAAEVQRVLKQKIEAIELYDRAIAGAKENRYIQDEALANELAAKFYINWGKEKIAATYMQEAYYCYARWGAKAKIDHLKQTYPQLLTPIIQQSETIPHSSNRQTSTQSFGTVTTTTSVLDLTSVIEASQALSEEIELNTLLPKLMHIVLENAGANQGALLLENSGRWEIAAQCVNGNCQLLTTPLEQTETLPSSIINTVKRTQQTLLINNLEQDKTFAGDPYLIQHQPQSLCCTPIFNQGKLVGILYLENNVATEAFTPDRIKVLNLLTTQAAISIENARLYNRLENYNRTLEQQVTQRTEQLQHKNQELAQTLQELKATQDGLIQSEKMAALGQLVAGIAHEINTPLGAIRAAIGNTDKALEDSLSQLPQLLPQLNAQQQTNFFSFLEQALGSQTSLSTREKRQIKRTLTQQLESHGIANAKQLAHLLTEGALHQSVDSQLSLLQTPQANQIVQIAYDIARLRTNSKNINNAVERASKIVFALKSYARYDHSGEKQLVQITDGIEMVLELYHNYLKKGVTVIRQYQPVPEIACYTDELVQVWTNLIHNAVQAMDSKGTLHISVGQHNQEIVVEFTDSGAGIPLDIQDKIFQPFFTTKPAGEGSGLGLDIVQKIVAKHQGTITFTSVPGSTTFTLTLPLQ
ncbi:trifunctional serine/threonine-protein kinase/ATP-binding protein/sensor histidine kinase [Coleofasciculus sp. E1-EBD-02]|uniref:trifunctional serine/threonine-protein kinase/ATP-binding protein/sensor histidine kinase n=1 Tax=Coleofasciculus sp. E1-EBD-02 TaxID=3068481 RepID=UPI0032F1BB29